MSDRSDDSEAADESSSDDDAAKDRGVAGLLLRGENREEKKPPLLAMLASVAIAERPGANSHKRSPKLTFPDTIRRDTAIAR